MATDLLKKLRWKDTVTEIPDPGETSVLYQMSFIMYITLFMYFRYDGM